MRPHRFEPVSAIFGLVFAGTGLLVLTGGLDLWRLNWSWFWPLVLTLGGVAILLSLRGNSSTPRTPRDDSPLED